MGRSFHPTVVFGAAALGLAGLFGQPAAAEPLALASPNYGRSSVFDRVLRQQDGLREESPRAVLPAHLRRQIVDYHTSEAPGTIIIDTARTHLYLVLGQGRALRYGIGVGREGFTWSGVETITRMAEWPDWHPPAEMISRQPYLPRFMAGGPGNPLGARALYLGNTAYRIHGTNDPTTIGQHVSSGCIRMTNEDVIDLYGRTKQGAKVVVLPGGGRRAASLTRMTTTPASAPISAVRSDSDLAFGLH